MIPRSVSCCSTTLSTSAGNALLLDTLPPVTWQPRISPSRESWLSAAEDDGALQVRAGRLMELGHSMGANLIDDLGWAETDPRSGRGTPQLKFVTKAAWYHIEGI